MRSLLDLGSHENRERFLNLFLGRVILFRECGDEQHHGGVDLDGEIVHIDWGDLDVQHSLDLWLCPPAKNDDCAEYRSDEDDDFANTPESFHVGMLPHGPSREGSVCALCMTACHHPVLPSLPAEVSGEDPEAAFPIAIDRMEELALLLDAPVPEVVPTSRGQHELNDITPS